MNTNYVDYLQVWEVRESKIKQTSGVFLKKLFVIKFWAVLIKKTVKLYLGKVPKTFGEGGVQTNYDYSGWSPDPSIILRYVIHLWKIHPSF